MLTDSLERMQRQARLPDVAESWCVHSVCREAECRACVEACPHGAWLFDEDSLAIDTALCDGCGRCVPACPMGALTLAEFGTPVTRTLRSGDVVALASCESAGTAAGEGTIACLHALGLGALLDVRQAGTARLVVAQGACAECPRGRGAGLRLEESVAALNRLLESRGAAVMDLVHILAAEWDVLRREEVVPDVGPSVGRRDFLRLTAARVVTETAQVIAPQPDADAPAPLVPPAARLPQPAGAAGEAPAALYPFVPEIDPETCTGCHSCVRVCLFGALRFDPHSISYRLDPAYCVGCRLCLDVCPTDAMRLEPEGGLRQTRVALESMRCTSCGVTVYMPLGRLPETRECRICQQNDHYRKLFQVDRDA